MSRFRAFLLLAAVAVVAAALAACGGSGSSDDPQQVIDEATIEGVESGNLDLAIGLTATGKDGGKVDVTLSGPFQGQGEGELPQFALSATAKGSLGGSEKVDFKGGLTLLGEEAYVEYDGTEYAVDPTTFGFVKAAIEKAQKQNEAEGEEVSTACQQVAAETFQGGDLIENPVNDGSADVDGTETTKISGELSVAEALDSIVGLAEDPACASQFQAAGGLPVGELKEAKDKVGEAVQRAEVDVYVGDDGIVRKLVANLTVEPPAEEDGPNRLDLSLEMSLSGVNETQEITAPKGAKELGLLFQRLNVNPIQLLELGSSGNGLEGLLEQATGAAGS